MENRDDKGQFVNGHISNGSRPSKLTPEFMEFMEKTLNQGLRMIIFTDEDWVDLINEDLAKIKNHKELGLPKSISIGAWERWKRKAKMKNQPDEKFRQFFRLIKKLFSQQREGLFNKLATDKVAWQRWAWIIERKFDDWNLRIKSENLNKHEVIDKIEVEIINPNEAKTTVNTTNESESVCEEPHSN